MSKVRQYLIFKSPIKAADNSRLCFIYATYLSYTSTQDVKNLGVISKLCDVNITNKPKRINHEQKGRG
nr:MAG TPA: hypothetical protein [Caudoviricetes sp.]